MSIVILSLVSLIITLPFFLSNGLIASYDIFFHVVWSEQFYKALTEGILYPRWVDTPFGYGSPTFIFYAPLSFYVISLINILTNSHLFSIKIAICLGFLLSGLCMYFFARKLNEHRAGLISGVLYQLIPYHIFELFIRGSVSALFAFIWFPLVLLFMREIFTERKFSSIAFVSLAYAGLILTHLVSAFMFTFVMVGYGLYFSFIEKKKGLLRMLCAMALGIGLSSIYLIPVILERGFVHIEAIKQFNYSNNFLFLYESLLKEPLNRIALIDAVFLITSFILVRRNFLTTKNAFFVVLATMSLFLTTSLSSFVWKYMPGFPSLQFPWRWLTFSGLSVSIIAGDMVVNLKGKLLKTLCLILLLPLFLSFFIMSRPVALADIDFWRQHSVAYSPFEYRPVWLKEPGKMLPAVEKIKIIRGSGSVNIIDWKSNRRILSANGDNPITLRFSTFYYPGWVARVDEKNYDITVEKDSGSIIVEVPEGRHKVELIFEDTSVRYYGKMVSFVSLILILSIFLYAILNRSKKNL